VSPELYDELSEALRNNDGKLGLVFALLEAGKTSTRELVDGGAAANQGAASNIRVTVRAVLDGVLPKGPSVALQVRRSIGGLLRDNPDLSSEEDREVQCHSNRPDREGRRDPPPLGGGESHQEIGDAARPTREAGASSRSCECARRGL
jgi:hypothetical protein